MPAILFAWKRRLLPESIVLGILFVASTLVGLSLSLALPQQHAQYHFCQTEVFCLFPAVVMRELDHIWVYTAFTWITLYFIEPPWQVRVAVLFLAQALLIPFVVSYPDAHWVSGMIIGVVLIGALVVLIFVAGHLPKIDWIDLFVAAVLVAGGFTVFILAGDPGNSKYPAGHGVWHILSMLAIYFVLEAKDGVSFPNKLLRFLRSQPLKV